MSQAQGEFRGDQYLIVDFPEESKEGNISMALISSSWLFEENGILYCYWPTYLKSTTSREKTVKNHIPLQIQKCMKCAVVVKYNDADYDKTCAKLKKLEEESEMSSASADFEEFMHPKKSYKTNRDVDYIYSDVDSDDDHSLIPVAPKFPKEKPKKTFARLTITESKAESQNQFGQQITSRHTTVEKPKKTFALLTVPESEAEIQNQFGQQITLRDTTTEHEQINNTKVLTTSHPISRSIQTESVCTCGINSKMLERLIRDVQSLKLGMKTLVQQSESNKFPEFQELENQFGFKEYQEIVNFNEKLLDSNYFNKMQTSISLLGGRDLNETTRRILSLLMSHELLLNVNWVGANKKGSIQKLGNVLKLIYGVVRKNQATLSATNSEIDSAIKQWYKNAGDREGGRAKRRQKLPSSSD